MLKCRSHAYWRERTVRHLGDAELDKLRGSCREYSLPRSDKSSQVKGWIRGTTKIGPVLDVGQLSSRPLRSQVHDEFSIWRWNSLIGEDRERDKQLRNGDVGSDSYRRLERVPGNLLRRQDRNRHHARCYLPRRRDSNSAWIPVHLETLLSSNSRPFWWKTHWSYIARQGVVTERLRRAQLSRWKLPRLTLHNPVWIDSGWEKMSRKRRLAVFFTAVNPMFGDQHREVEYDLTKPRIAVYKNKWKVHQHTVYCNLRVAQSKGLQFYQTRSNAINLYNTLPAVYIEKVVNMMSREKNCTVKCISLLSYRKELYWSRTCTLNARVLPTLKREHPSTILVKSTEKPVAVESTGRTVTVTSTSESKDCRIQLSNNKMTPTRKAVKKLIHLFGTHLSREALKADLEKDQEFKPFSEKSKDMIRSMGNIGVLRDVPITVNFTYWTTSIV